MKKEEYLRLRSERALDKGRALSGRPYDTSLIPIEVKPTSEKFQVTCPDHGPWMVSYHSFRSSGCPACGIERMKAARRANPTTSVPKLTLSELRDRVRLRFPQIEFLDTPLTAVRASNNRWRVRCATHGLEVTKKLHSLAWDKSVTTLCPECATEKARNKENLVAKAEQGTAALRAAANLLGYTVVSCSGSHAPVVLKCPAHGHFTIKKAYYVTQKQSGCPGCRETRSVAEATLAGHLKDLGPIDFNRRDLLANSGLELDLYFPRYRVAVEVNGVYFHGSDRYEVSHAKKHDLAEAANIQLLQFTDIEVARKLSLVLSMIRAKCGLFQMRGYAKELTVDTEVPVEEARSFLTDHHIQGYVGSRFRIGLRGAKGRLVQLATFGSPRFTSSADWELLRLASHQGVQVVGGASRLLAAFLKSHPGTLVSYADCRYSVGSVYEASGFRRVRRTKASYTYVKGGRTVTRYQAQVARLKSPGCPYLTQPYDPELSEWENMKLSGWHRVFDAGTLVYLK